MSRGKTRTLQAVLTVSTLAIGAGGATAQDLDPAVSGNLSFSSNLVLDTNPSLAAVSSGAVLEFSEDIGFSLQSETSTQTLQFSVSTGFAISTTVGGGTDTSFEPPAVDFLYRREGANANFEVSADYWNGDVTSAFDIDPTDETFLIVDSGVLVRSSAALAYSWGLNAPLGFSVSASFDTRNYDGTTDPALFDTTTTSFSGAANFRLSPATNGSLTATLTDYTSDDAFATSSETKELGLTISHELATGLTVDGNVGFRDVATIASGAPSTENGIYFGVDLTQPVPNGSFFGGIQVDQSGSTNTTALTFGRSLDLPDGNLTASITADQAVGSSVMLLGSLSYLRELSDGSITVDASQTLSTNTLSEDVRFSTLGIAYTKILNSNSGMVLAFDISRSEDGGAGAAETLNRATLSASYSREITEDWDMSVGYTHRQNTGSATATGVSDSIFLTLTRDLEFRF